MPDQLTPVRNFFEKYGTTSSRVLDVGGGGLEIQEITNVFGHIYEALNISGHPTYNVSDCPYNWPIIDNTFDYVVSVSTFEHIEFPWLSFLEMVRVTKQNGYIFIMAPSAGNVHGDWDGWRYYKGSMEAFAKWGKVKLLEAFIDDSPFSGQWLFCIGIFKKEME